MELIDIFGLFFAGLIGGFLSGMLGVGGGIIFVPVIQQVLINHSIGDDFVAYTLSNSLALVFAVGVSGTIQQLKFKNTHLPSAMMVGSAAIVTSLSITYLITYFKIGNQKTFNIIFAFILIVSVLRMLVSDKKEELNSESIILPNLLKFIPAGLFAGFVTALSGLGGGIVMVPYFNKILKLPIKFSTGLSLSVIPIIALPLLIFYGFKVPNEMVYKNYQTGYLIWPIILPIISMAIFASRIGVKFSQKLKPEIIKLIFVTFVCLTLVKILLL